jgi:hypothetical protein
MADTTTTNYGLTKPEVGASEDTWGTKINTNLDTLDTTVDSIQGKSGAGVLKHTNNTKLATTSTGIDVTGNMISDGVGIGTSSPSYPFHLSSSGDTVAAVTAGAASVAALNLGNSTNLADGGIRYDNSANALILRASNTERMRIDASGRVGIGTTNPDTSLHVTTPSGTKTELNLAQTAVTNYRLSIPASTDALTFVYGASTERMRIDASGNVLVGKTAAGFANTGHELRGGGSYAAFTRDGGTPVLVNRKSSDGTLVEYMKDGTTVGSIGTTSSTMWIAGNSTQDTGIRCYTVGIAPCNSSGVYQDNSRDLGSLTVRWDDIYATNGTIQTSDFNEKQDIAELTDAEQRVAVAAKGLLRKFRWKDSVAEKGDEARTHFGIIAQDLQAAFAAEGLDAGDYAMFISSTWTDEETNEEKTRMGVRYSELLAFIIAAI